MKNHWRPIGYEEIEYTKNCVQKMGSCLWANKLITEFNKIMTNNDEFPEEKRALLFEIRFAYALSKLGHDIQNGYKCGTKNSEIGVSDVDFCISETNGTKWFIELTSLNESNDVKEKTILNANWFSYTSRESDPNKEPDSYKIYRRAQSNILEKAAKKKDEVTAKPTKFLPPKAGEYNIIIIDMRGFMVATPDKHDYAAVINGENANWDKGLKGLFDQNHPDPRVKYLQERIHGIGFILERNYVEGELQEVLEIFANPKFFKSDDELKIIFH